MAPARGVLKVRVRRGIGLVVCDALTSDPYVVVTHGDQKVKTSVINSDCNPVWNEELTLHVKDPSLPIKLTVVDKDTFSQDDEMGDAAIDIHPLLENVKMGFEELPNGTRVDRIQPNTKNCLAEESRIIWNDGKMTQDMILKLRNVRTGKVEIQIEWIDHPGSISRGRFF